MNNQNSDTMKKDYSVPCLRLLVFQSEISFLASNLEPIEGGGDPDIDW
jgi:hypothetical protein